jgi:hypothetical protein
MALEFAESLPAEAPETLPVYQLREPPSGQAVSAELARTGMRLGLGGRPQEIRTTEHWTVHQEGLFELAMNDLSGALLYRHRERYQRPGQRPFEVADDAAIAVAGTFVEQAELVPMEEAGVLEVTHLRTVGGAPGETVGEETLLDAGVIYGRSVEGFVVRGQGGSAMVNVDADGEVVGFHRVWRERAGVAREVRIVSPERAQAEMQRIANELQGDTTVIRADFGYSERGVSDRQRFLQPAYMMVYEVRNDELAWKSAVVLAAGDQQLEPLEEGKRFPSQPQRRRQPR